MNRRQVNARRNRPAPPPPPPGMMFYGDKFIDPAKVTEMAMKQMRWSDEQYLKKLAAAKA